MRVLLVKTSSLGDVLHALPALTDAANAIPGIQFDWVVESPFAEVPVWHPAVDRVIPVSIRRWRKSPLKALFSGEWVAFKKRLRAREYDLVLDAQGLIKSGLITRMARGPKYGLDSNSAREPLASRFYNHPLSVEKGEHAIVRLRKLFALALGYPFPDEKSDSGILPSYPPPLRRMDRGGAKSILFIHGTTWITKHWPDRYWIELAEIVNRAGYRVVLPWANKVERARAEQIADGRDAIILPKGSLSALIEPFQQASGMICVDSGLAHLGAALKIPSVTLYGATNPGLTGTWGENQQHLTSSLTCSPCLKRRCEYRGASEVDPACYQSLTPEVVWQQLAISIKSHT
ncbi:MAG: lipopolysaccharide heptosyltransferase I [Gammaproteobacteria bacterium]|nr:lipopolysaccharide heptosyltransferase I [Gammaproteobacteria bacterium]